MSRRTARLHAAWAAFVVVALVSACQEKTGAITPAQQQRLDAEGGIVRRADDLIFRYTHGGVGEPEGLGHRDEAERHHPQGRETGPGAHAAHAAVRAGAAGWAEDIRAVVKAGSSAQ